MILSLATCKSSHLSIKFATFKVLLYLSLLSYVGAFIFGLHNFFADFFRFKLILKMVLLC